MKYLTGEHRAHYTGVPTTQRYWCVLGDQIGLKPYINSKTGKDVRKKSKHITNINTAISWLNHTIFPEK